MLARVDRITEYDNVLSVNWAVGQQPAPDAGVTVVRLVDEKIVANQQGLLHRFRRNLKSLEDESDDKDRYDDGSCQGLQSVEGTFLTNRRRWGVLLCNFAWLLWGVYFTHDCSELSGLSRVLSTVEGLSTDCRRSQARRAAACSAAFLVLPWLRQIKA